MENNIEPFENNTTQRSWEREEAYLRAKKKGKSNYWILLAFGFLRDCEYIYNHFNN